MTKLKLFHLVERKMYHATNFRNKLLFVKSMKSLIFDSIKGAVGSGDLKISKSALLSLNHHNFSNTKPIYTE